MRHVWHGYDDIDKDLGMQARIAASLSFVAACLNGVAPASAQGNTGFYLEGNLGYAIPDSVDARAGGIDGEVDLKNAAVFGGALGYRFPWVRLEFNGSYRKFDTDKIKAQGGSVSGNGDATAVVGLFNVYLDHDLGGGVHPYLGGGIGGAYVKLDTGDDAPLSVDDEAGAFTWNLAAGLSYDFTDHVTLSAGYRYLRFEGTDFSASVAGVDTGNVDIDDVTSHEILIGLRYTF
jgi:opacity protein-like surface antigen